MKRAFALIGILAALGLLAWGQSERKAIRTYPASDGCNTCTEWSDGIHTCTLMWCNPPKGNITVGESPHRWASELGPEWTVLLPHATKNFKIGPICTESCPQSYDEQRIIDICIEHGETRVLKSGPKGQ